jgi:hypothetical protein
MRVSKSAENMTVRFSAGGMKHPAVLLIVSSTLFTYPILLLLISPENVELFSVVYVILILVISGLFASESMMVDFRPNKIEVSKFILGFYSRSLSFDISSLESIYVARKRLSFYRGFDTMKREICLVENSKRRCSGAFSKAEADQLEQEIKTWLRSHDITSVRIG